MEDVNAFFDGLLFQSMPGKIVVAVVGLLLMYFVIQFLRNRVINQRIKQPDVRNQLRMLTNLFGYAAMALYAFSIFSDSLSQLTVLFGVMSAGIAFALQEVIASIAGWVALSLGGFYETGDRVQVGGIKGDVIHIGLLRTTVVEIGDWVDGDLYNGRVVRIANSFVFKEPVYNYSGDFPFLWDEITIPVKYGSDRRLAQTILEQIITETTRDYSLEAGYAWAAMVSKYAVENASVAPAVTLSANDNWLQYTVRYVVEFKRRRWTKDVLFNRILDAFDETDGKVSIASTTIQIVETPTVSVRLTK